MNIYLTLASRTIICFNILLCSSKALSCPLNEDWNTPTYASINTLGKTVIKNTTYSESIWTVGSVVIEKSIIDGSVKAGGKCSIEDSVVTGSITTTGSTTITNSTLKKDIDVTGSLVLTRSQVEGLIVVNGTFNAEQISAQDLDIMGRTTIDKGSIKACLRVIGALTISNSSMQSLDVTGDESTLRNVSIETLKIRRSPHHSHGVTGWVGSAFCRLFPYKDELTIVVEGASVIKNITFESEDGRVIIKGNSVVIDHVTGGTIYRQQ